MRAIRFEQTGGPDVLQVADAPAPTPKPGQVLIRHEAIGINFIETYFRSGLYPMKLPSGLGSEAAGVVDRKSTRLNSSHRIASRMPSSA